MSRISRAGDTLWSVSAFDPRKPVADDWWRQPPAPVLRDGSERHVFEGGPTDFSPGDEMRSSPEGTGGNDFLDDEPEDVIEPDHGIRMDVPNWDRAYIGEYGRLVRDGGGSLEGRDTHHVEYHPTSSTVHFYTFNPRGVDDPQPWNLVSTHWALRNPMQSRHPSFGDAAAHARVNRHMIDRRVG